MMTRRYDSALAKGCPEFLLGCHESCHLCSCLCHCNRWLRQTRKTDACYVAFACLVCGRRGMKVSWLRQRSFVPRQRAMAQRCRSWWFRQCGSIPLVDGYLREKQHGRRCSSCATISGRRLAPNHAWPCWPIPGQFCFSAVIFALQL